MSSLMRISIYLDGMFCGTLRMPRPDGVVTEEWLTQEISRRLPTMRGKPYTIEIDS